MGNRRYPRIVRVQNPKQKNGYGKCKFYKGCDEMSTCRVEIQYSYLRGEDEYYPLCTKHKDEIKKECH